MTIKDPSGWHSLGEIFQQGIFAEKLPARDWRSLSYDSPLESWFARHLSQYLHSNAEIETQVPVVTICGSFRLDFVVHRDGRKVAFECDGREYHDEGRDEWRDAMILGAESVDVLYRFRGRDLTYHIEDCLFLVSQWEPDIFSPRGLLQLKERASEQARHYVGIWSGEAHTFHLITYPVNLEQNYRDPMHIFVVRNSTHVPLGVQPFWKSLFQYAQKRGGGNLDDLRRQW